VGVAGTDDSFACPSCGGSFTFKAGEAKLTGVGELDELRNKVASHDADLVELKKALPASRPGAQPPEEPSRNPDSPFDDDDESEDEDEDL